MMQAFEDEDVFTKIYLTNGEYDFLVQTIENLVKLEPSNSKKARLQDLLFGLKYPGYQEKVIANKKGE